MKPEIALSHMTGCWYVVTAWKSPGCAKTKYDVTEQMNTHLSVARKEAAPSLTAANQRLRDAIERHFGEVYGGETEGPFRPNFIWDIEMYQAAGLLPSDFPIPDEDELEGTNYHLRKLLVETTARLQHRLNYISDDQKNVKIDEALIEKVKNVLESSTPNLHPKAERLERLVGFYESKATTAYHDLLGISKEQYDAMRNGEEDE